MKNIRKCEPTEKLNALYHDCTRPMASKSGKGVNYPEGFLLITSFYSLHYLHEIQNTSADKTKTPPLQT